MEIQNNNDLKVFDEVSKIKEVLGSNIDEKEKKLMDDYIESLKRTESNNKRISLKKNN